MKWEYEEEILLIGLYDYTLSHNKIDNEAAIKQLSGLLRKRAYDLGFDIDETFRNITGIKMKLLNIEYLASDGEYGLSAYSKLDAECYEYYKKEFVSFCNELKEISEKYKANY